MPTPNEDLASKCGQEKTCKEPLEAVEQKEGTYECPVSDKRKGGKLLPGGGANVDPEPFSGLHGGK
jgi:hypothetical protein